MAYKKKSMLQPFPLIFILLCPIFFCVSATNNTNTSQTEYELLIISPTEFISELSLLQDHKNSKKITTQLLSLDEIYQQYPGRDPPEQIKYCIQHAIETYNTHYTLLIGDISILPIRTSYVTWDTYKGPIFETMITDYYYADIYTKNGSFSTWDTNNNNRFSEVNIMTYQEDNETFTYIDELDLYPDIAIGRLPCKNTQEVKRMINKIITYENKPSSVWSKKLLLLGGDTFPECNWPGASILEGEYVTSHIASLLPEFTPTYLKTSDGSFNPLHITFELTKGAGIVCYSGHGFEYGFATNKPNSTNLVYYYLPYLVGMFNFNKQPLVYMDACLTAKIDYNISGLEIPCFAWAITKKPFGGAIACIGSTAPAYGGFTNDPFACGSPRLIMEFFSAYNPEKTIGEILNNAKTSYLDSVFSYFPDCMTPQQFTLIGDPTIQIH